MVDKKMPYITVAKIINTKGHKGEVKAIVLTDFPQRFEHMSRVRLQQGGHITYQKVEKFYPQSKFIIFKFTGIDDMDTAQTLKEAEIVVTKQELMPLPEHTYYVFDLIGLKVFTAAGRYLGQISDVISTGANDVYMVEGVTPRALLIPALKSVVQNIDVPGGQIIVELPPGLED